MNYLIIGNGVAGVEASLAIRKNDPKSEISIISKSKNLHYYRPRLIDYIAGEATLDQITIYKDDFYKKKNIRNILSTRVTSINGDGRTITDNKGEKYYYDRLLIAAGGKPFVPPIKGADKNGVFTLRGAADAERIVKKCRESENIIVIGGGLLGLETAHSLRRTGKNVTVIEFSKWLLPRQLDRDGGNILKKLLSQKGIDLLTDESVVSIDGGDNIVEKVILKSGKELNADAVIISAGIRPDLRLAESAGVKINRGVIVDNYMRTFVKDIYAAGDIIEHNEICYGLWGPAKEQGNIAGLNMAGVETEYRGSVLSSILKIVGIDLCSAGDVNDQESEVFVLKDDSSYKKLLIKDNKPTGVIVLGDKDALKIAQKVMEGIADPEEFKKLL